LVAAIVVHAPGWSDADGASEAWRRAQQSSVGSYCLTETVGESLQAVNRDDGARVCLRDDGVGRR
jgi:hypothetical protein